MQRRWIALGFVLASLLIAMLLIMLKYATGIPLIVTRAHLADGSVQVSVEFEGRGNFEYSVFRRDELGLDRIVGGGQMKSGTRFGFLQQLPQVKSTDRKRLYRVGAAPEDVKWSLADEGPRTLLVYSGQDLVFAEIDGQKYLIRFE